jgi:hypothetical protein
MPLQLLSSQDQEHRTGIMTQSIEPCPACGGPMILVAEIKRGYSNDLYVFRCKLCDTTVKKAVDGALEKPARST